MLYCLLSFLCWGCADLFYKKGNNDSKDKYSYWKTGAIVGLVMGLHAFIYMIVNKTCVNMIDLIKYLPVSFCYIASMVIGYKGLKYIELSISSPIQNTSGVITAILLILFFKETYDILAYVGIGIVFLGILILSIKEYKENRNFDIKIARKKLTMLAIVLPLMYCILDGLGTFLDGIYLDKLELMSEDSALLSYEYTFFIYGIFSLFYLQDRKEKLSFKNDHNKLYAAILETIGQFFYVFAMAEDSVIGATIIGSYFVLSLLLSRIFLKERLDAIKYSGIFVTAVGIFILLIQGV